MAASMGGHEYASAWVYLSALRSSCVARAMRVGAHAPPAAPPASCSLSLAGRAGARIGRKGRVPTNDLDARTTGCYHTT